MAAAGKVTNDDELVGNILTGLDFDYFLVVSVVLARVETIFVSGLYTQLLTFDQLMDLLHGGSQPSANSTSHGGRDGGWGN